jgi:hypothetical protein
MEVYSAMIMRVKARMDTGEDVPDCLIKTLLMTQEKEKLDWEDLCFMANAFNLGGVHSVLIKYIGFSPRRSANPVIAACRLRVLSCGFWLLSRHAQKFKREPMQNLTAWLAEMVGQVQRTSNTFRTSGPSSRRCATKLRSSMVSSI